MRWLIFIFFALWVTKIQAQNWQPLQTGKTYNYITDNNENEIRSIFIEKAESLASDTIYHLNKVTARCKECFFTLELYKDESLKRPEDVIFVNRAQFMGRKVIKSNTNIYFTDTVSYKLEPFANTGHTWTFDSVNNISAKVYSTKLETVLGISDSVKTILLGTGDTIKISKNYGMIRFPVNYGTNKYYQLIGIESENAISFRIPKYNDIFNFDIGDQFKFEENVKYANAQEEIRTTALQINSKSITNGRYTYNICGTIALKGKIDKFNIADFSFYTHQENAPFNNGYPRFDPDKFLPFADQNSYLKYNEKSKRYSIKNGFDDCTVEHKYNSNILLEYSGWSINGGLSCDGGWGYDIIEEGVGITLRYRDGIFTGPQYTRLVALKTKSYSFGQFTGDFTDCSTSIYPNTEKPLQTEIMYNALVQKPILELRMICNSNQTNFRIISKEGKVLSDQYFASRQDEFSYQNFAIDVSSLAPGLYFMQISQGSLYETIKFIVQR